MLRLREPLTIAEDGRLLIDLEFLDPTYTAHVLGRFRLSVSGDPAVFARESRRFAVMKFADPWVRLATAYRLLGDQPAIDSLVQRQPAAAAATGDLYAADQDWGRAIAA